MWWMLWQRCHLPCTVLQKSSAQISKWPSDLLFPDAGGLAGTGKACWGCDAAGGAMSGSKSEGPSDTLSNQCCWGRSPFRT
jgi:hypothetical protein